MLHKAWIEYCHVIQEKEGEGGRGGRGGVVSTPIIQSNLGKMWKTYSPRCPKSISRGVFALGFMHLISNGLNEVNINALT